MNTVHLDWETRSALDLKKVGHARYSEEADTLCGAFALNGAEVGLWLPGDSYPKEMAAADQIVAHSALFEYFIWLNVMEPRYGWPAPPPLDMWYDTMAGCSYAGLPRALWAAVRAAHLPEKYYKDPAGARLIQLLCKPQKKTKKNPTGAYDESLLPKLYDYCKQDVRAERALHHFLPPLPAMEQRIWVVTQQANVRGFPMDREFVYAACQLVHTTSKELNAEASTLAKGAFEKLTQVAKVKDWLGAHDCVMPNMTKKSVGAALDRDDLDPGARRILEIRQQVGLASVKKYVAAKKYMCHDDTIKSCQIYHGAGTGRWSASGFQPHNITRPELKPAEVAAMIRAIKNDAYEGEDPLTDVSNCVRGSICAAPGRRLTGSDYAAVEVRVMLWFAGDSKHLDAIEAGHDPYLEMATKYYGEPVTEKKDPRRQVGKSAVLGCQFQLAGPGFRTYAADRDVILSEGEAARMVKLYRDEHPKVVSFWYAMQEAALAATKTPGKLVRCGRIYFQVQANWLQMRLPSGRNIMYYEPRAAFEEKPWGITEVTAFTGNDTHTRQYGATSTYGGKLAENAVQGAARDLMARGWLIAEKQGLNPVLAVHDELLCHPPRGMKNPQALLDRCLLHKPKWAVDLPLEVEGWAGKRYRK